VRPRSNNKNARGSEEKKYFGKKEDSKKYLGESS
jgi:hypothetical protein